MATIVISYRRDDSRWIALSIFERLESHYGKGNVFMDIDSIPLGLDFLDHIRETLGRCDVLVALVGPNWMGKDQTNENIFNETDWVRIEIEAALSKKIPLIPILIDHSQMPKPDELPEGLKSFAFRQAARIDTENFHSNMDKIIASIDGHFSKLSRPILLKSTIPQNTETKVRERSPPTIQPSPSTARQKSDRPKAVRAAQSALLVIAGCILIVVGFFFFPSLFGILALVGALVCLIAAAKTSRNQASSR